MIFSGPPESFTARRLDRGVSAVGLLLLSLGGRDGRGRFRRLGLLLFGRLLLVRGRGLLLGRR